MQTTTETPRPRPGGRYALEHYNGERWVFVVQGVTHHDAQSFIRKVDDPENWKFTLNGKVLDIY